MTASAPSTSRLQTSTPQHSDDDLSSSKHDTLDNMDVMADDILPYDHLALEDDGDDGADLPNINEYNDAEILDYESDDHNSTTFRHWRTTASRKNLCES